MSCRVQGPGWSPELGRAEEWLSETSPPGFLPLEEKSARTLFFELSGGLAGATVTTDDISMSSTSRWGPGGGPEQW